MPQPEAQITRYQRWLREQRGLSFDRYEDLWQWSVDDLSGFWQSVWDFFDIQSPTPAHQVLDGLKMPGAKWFGGAQVNYAQQVLRHADALHAAGHPAIVFADEPLLAAGQLRELSWPELKRQVACMALALRRMGVQRGDRVCAVLANTPETAVVFLACASIGALWSVCSPDMGPVAVLDRFHQIAPTVLIAADGYRWGGQAHDRRAVLAELLAGLPSVRHLVLWARLDETADALAFAGPDRQASDLATLLRGDGLDSETVASFAPEWLPFDQPLWVVYSSGTTGLPKPIVHGHGGVMLEGLKLGTLHNNVGPTLLTGERFHWFSTTGWIMWNSQVAGLLGGTTVCIYDGNPGGCTPGTHDWSTLWRFAGLARVSFFGAGAAFYASCGKAGVEPQQVADLSALRAIGSTGSPLSDDSYRWIWNHLPKVDGHDIWLTSISGGTDFAGAFLAGVPTLPVVAGEMVCRCLGAAVEAWSEDGRPLIDEVGELVCVKPMPSMPLYLWGDPNGQRLHDSYFDMYPGVWRHGDWLRLVPHGDTGTCGAVIYGRSDATINRHGVRMGTAELYRAVEALPEVLDSLVVDLEYLGRESWMPLFVVLREGVALDAALTARIKAEVRQALSPRHVPNDVFQVAAIPRTLSGKKMELPVKKLLMGADPDAVMKRDAMANAQAVDWFIELAHRRAAAGHGSPQPIPNTKMSDSMKPVILLLVPMKPMEEGLAAVIAVQRPDAEVLRWQPDLPAADLARVNVVLGWAFPPGLAARLTGLRWVCSMAAGVEKLLVPDLAPQVPLSRIVDPDQALGIAQYVAAVVLDHTRGLARYRAQAPQRDWTRHPMAAARHRVGVLGYGEVGREVGRVLSALGFQVQGWRRDGTALHDLLGSSDIVVNTLPLTPATAGLLDAAAFAAMPRGAFLVNIARGGHVVEADLIAALRTGQLGGAALDVQQREPLPADDALWTEPSITITPHIAAQSSLETVASQFVAGLAALAEGRALPNPVDRSRGY